MRWGCDRPTVSLRVVGPSAGRLRMYEKVAGLSGEDYSEHTESRPRWETDANFGPLRATDFCVNSRIPRRDQRPGCKGSVYSEDREGGAKGQETVEGGGAAWPKCMCDYSGTFCDAPGAGAGAVAGSGRVPSEVSEASWSQGAEIAGRC